MTRRTCPVAAAQCYEQVVMHEGAGQHYGAWRVVVAEVERAGVQVDLVQIKGIGGADPVVLRWKGHNWKYGLKAVHGV